MNPSMGFDWNNYLCVQIGCFLKSALRLNFAVYEYLNWFETEGFLILFLIHKRLKKKNNYESYVSVLLTILQFAQQYIESGI